ncbi:MAG: 3-hydroxybutyryl-CoA dehydrogenase [Actinobacteria bacterium]|nr:3-hydroxybutyryl-CoA dehydrogenase [Actinomycetota bacterium]
MGSGIGQIAAAAGHEVALQDVSEASLQAADAAISTSLARLVKAGRSTEAESAGSKSRIHLVTEIAQAVSEASVVIEVVPERLSVKHAVFAEIIARAPAEALLGTNTSQLSITSIGTVLGDRAANLVGMHFFNPPVMMQLIELVRGLLTSDETIQRAREFATGLGKQVVVCQKDSPGFLTSRISAIMRLECLRMLEEGLASPEDIDTAIKLAFNHPMGPLELGDFNGLDTYLDAVKGLAEAHGDRFTPTVNLRNMVAAGRLGRKTGHGFYRYDSDGKRISP